MVMRTSSGFFLSQGREGVKKVLTLFQKLLSGAIIEEKETSKFLHEEYKDNNPYG